jgi:hypothetical protein
VIRTQGRSKGGKRGKEDIHGEPDNHEAQARDDEGAPLADPVRAPGGYDGQDSGNDVDRHGHELRGAAGVSETLDDGREEKADAVQRADNLRR